MYKGDNMKIKTIVILLLLLGSVEVYANTPELKLLMCNDSLPYNEGRFFIIPKMGLFVQNDNEIVALDGEKCSAFRKARLKQRYRCDKFFTEKEKLFIQSDDLVLQMSGDSVNVIIRLEDDNFEVFPAGNGLFSIVTPSINDTPSSKNDSVLFLWSIYNANSDTLIVQHAFVDPITEILSPIPNCYLIATGNSVLLVDSGKILSLAKAEMPIYSLAIIEKDIYFSIKKAVYRLCEDGYSYPIIVGGIHNMYADQRRMYLVMKDGNIYFMDL